ncbi:MAG: 50S ribosomal protein L15 [Thermodesulfobacteriota bacterium]|nr:MAG: 50S ribosomal protein L15 [Thermodesulfobacteriota bacterium]
MLDRLKPPAGAVKKKKRLGRGRGSGLGKTSGHGHKGQNARSGGGVRPGFEGGQMPLQRRLPKRGFTNKFRVKNRTVNVGTLADAFGPGETIDPAAIVEKGLVKGKRGPIKVLGTGEIKDPLTVKANGFSGSAVEKIEAAGGKAEVI